eukprot:8300801-Alexandrium_andersonii.AAC.1
MWDDLQLGLALGHAHHRLHRVLVVSAQDDLPVAQALEPAHQVGHCELVGGPLALALGREHRARARVLRRQD